MDDVDPSPDAISITDCLKYESIDAESTKHLSSGTNGYAPKVRKPYIMTKQREPWTEEQHQKFVEALKLYGRAWRQIEEYVGTKTAIQIRSHAQKFFAKVNRDSGACREVSLNLGDIPPPRPKKKPRHPYPRKMANIDVRDMESMNSDGQKYSPTSAFSATSGSGNVEADMQKPCLSPISCATSHISSEVENASPLAMEKSSASVSNKLTMKLELFPEVAESTIDSSYNARQGTSIKLFGKTVFISDAGAESLEENCGTKDQLLHNVEWKVQFFTEKEPRRAFVPYKRCLSERDDNSSMNLLEDWESRTARVCS